MTQILSELERAEMRADYGQLTRAAVEYHEYFLRQSRGASIDDLDFDAIDLVDDASRDVDKALALNAIISSRYDDADFLAFVKAGLLTPILWEPSQELVDRLTAEARRSARFCWMLSGILWNASNRWVLDKLQPLIGKYSMDRDLPPPP